MLAGVALSSAVVTTGLMISVLRRSEWMDALFIAPPTRRPCHAAIMLVMVRGAVADFGDTAQAWPEPRPGWTSGPQRMGRDRT